MKKLKNIFELIEKENIILEETIIRYNNTKGIYLNISDAFPTIFIDKTIIHDRCKYISILSEELGHHFTTSKNLTINSKTYSEKLQKNKEENKAKLWAANFIVSDEEFVQALCNCISTKCDLCDYFNMTNELLQYKIYSIILNENRYNSIRSTLFQREIPYESCAI